MGSRNLVVWEMGCNFESMGALDLDLEERFCQEYIIDFNGTRAYYRAGYTPKNDNVSGVESHKLLKNPKIQARLSELKQALQEKTGITQERVLQEYAKIAFFDIRKIYTESGNLKSVTDFDDDSAGAVIGIESYTEFSEHEPIGETKKVKIADKKGALDSLARHLGMFENDNKQLQPVNNIAPEIKVYASPVPLASSETDITD